jgi:ABC-2 type transport system permease protein
METVISKDGGDSPVQDKSTKLISGSGLLALFQKELADHIRSKRFLIVVALIAITGVASLYGALSGIQDVAAEAGTGYIFLKLFTTSSGSIPTFVAFLSLLGPLVGLVLGFDAINGERTRGTLGRLVSQPIYRDSIVNAKFLAGVTVIAVMVFSLGVIISGVGLVTIGAAPSSEEIARLVVFLLFTIVYMAFWLGLSILFSILCRHAATSALAVIAIWLVFAIFIGMLASIIANGLFPVSDYSTTGELISNYNATLYINRVSPSYLYSESVSTILDPGIRTVGLVTTAEASGAIVGTLPPDQSLLLVWPHLTGLLALTMISFALSYICFMRQEIRAG